MDVAITRPAHPVDLRRDLDEQARRLGFDACGVARIADLPTNTAERLTTFISLGRHGSMGWLADTEARRRHPTAMWSEARSAIMLAQSYAPADDRLQRLAEPGRGLVSCYAKGRDYHDVIKGKLKALAGSLHRKTGGEVKVFVDTAPLMEKPLAALAGIGWQGKHTNLVGRPGGSWLLLGVILTTAELAPDAPSVDRCGACRRCLDICPTAAFPAPYQLDARRCISYLTIEHDGHIPRPLRGAMGNHVFGCDDCLAVCPWNKFAVAGRESRLAAQTALDDPPLADLVGLDDAGFRRVFAGTAIKRIKRDRFIRNVLIAVANSGDAALGEAAVALLGDPAPVVRAMAVWAIGRLLEPERVRDLGRRHARGAAGSERDPAVRDEWRHALGQAGQGTAGATPRSERGRP